MSKETVTRCDLCREVKEGCVDWSMPGMVVGDTTYRKNDGDLCADCAGKLTDILKNTKEYQPKKVPIPDRLVKTVEAQSLRPRSEAASYVYGDAAEG